MTTKTTTLNIKAPAKPAVKAAAPVAAVKQAPKAVMAKPVAAKPAPAPITAPAAEWPVAEQVAAPVVKAAAAVTPALETIVETVTEVAAKAPVAIKKEVTKMTDTIKTVTDTVTNKGQEYFSDFTAKAKAAAEKGQKSIEDMNEFTKGNVEALVESGKIAAKGLESMGQGYAEYTRKSFETTTAAFKGFAAVKSPTDFFKLHSEFVKGQFDSMVSETSKNTEAMLKLAGEIAQPISNRVALAAEKMKIAA